MAQKIESFVLEGGLDLATPALKRHPGTLLSCANYEPSNIGGYDRIEGYERFDGRPSPYESVFYILDYDGWVSTPAVGASILGGTSAATGVVIAVVEEIASTSGYLVITKVTGTWQDNENIRNVGDTATYSVVNGTAALGDASTDELYKTYSLLAQTEYRDDIQAVPGSGNIRGVWVYDGDVYAFRDNAGGTAGVMHKATTSGWTTVSLGGSVTFDTGTTAEPAIGSTVTQAVTGATGVVIDTVYTGDWGAGSATGRIFLHTITGTFNGSDNLSWTGGTAVATGTVVNALPAGGNYEFINYNFQGQSSGLAMYGINGVGNGFQFDGTGFAFIYTTPYDGDNPIVTDTPDHLFAHKDHLFFAVESSIYHSALGIPLDWSVAKGAAEIATGDKVTGFLNAPGEALAVFDRNSTYILQGSSSLNWQLNTHSKTSGGVEWSLQNIGQTARYLDDLGIVSLETTQAYGDFTANSLSTLVEPLIQARRNLVTASTKVRSKNQYRLFFSDDSCLILRTLGQYPAFSLVEYPIPVLQVCSVEDAAGVERLFFGSNDGYIYEMDKGNSFDGADIEYRVRLSFNNLKSPRHKKRFFKAVVDIDNQEIPDLNFIAEFSYGSADIAQGLSFDASGTLNAAGAYWDDNDNWNEFNWDGQFSGQAEAYLDGSGLNMSLMISGTSNFEASHRLHGVSLHYSLRGIKR